MQNVPVVWDGYSLQNLASTKYEKEIILSLDRKSLVLDETISNEAMFLRPLPEENNDARELVKIEFSPLVSENILGVVGADEFLGDLFVEISQFLDDVDSKVVVSAFEKGCAIATDDKAVIRLIKMRLPNIRYITTPEWVSIWASKTRKDKKIIRDVIRRIHLCSNFVACKSDPLFEWWMNALS